MLRLFEKLHPLRNHIHCRTERADLKNETSCMEGNTYKNWITAKVNNWPVDTSCLSLQVGSGKRTDWETLWDRSWKEHVSLALHVGVWPRETCDVPNLEVLDAKTWPIVGPKALNSYPQVKFLWVPHPHPSRLAHHQQWNSAAHHEMLIWNHQILIFYHFYHPFPTYIIIYHPLTYIKMA